MPSAFDIIRSQVSDLLSHAKASVDAAKSDGVVTASEVLGIGLQVTYELSHDLVALAAAVNAPGVDKKQFVVDTILEFYDAMIAPALAAALPWYGSWISMYAIRPLIPAIVNAVVQGIYNKTQSGS